MLRELSCFVLSFAMGALTPNALVDDPQPECTGVTVDCKTDLHGGLGYGQTYPTKCNDTPQAGMTGPLTITCHEGKCQGDPAAECKKCVFTFTIPNVTLSGTALSCACGGLGSVELGGSAGTAWQNLAAGDNNNRSVVASKSCGTLDTGFYLVVRCSNDPSVVLLKQGPFTMECTGCNGSVTNPKCSE